MIKKKYPRERSTSTHVGVRIPNNLYKEVNTYRKERKFSLSTIIITALDNYMGLVAIAKKK